MPIAHYLRSNVEGGLLPMTDQNSKDSKHTIIKCNMNEQMQWKYKLDIGCIAFNRENGIVAKNSMCFTENPSLIGEVLAIEKAINITLHFGK